MFMIKNVGKLLFGGNSPETIIQIPQGHLYLVRPLSPKGYSELIFKDAEATIRKTGKDFQYQLVIRRAYEEGEEELSSDDDHDEAGIEDKDEKCFLLDESLRLRMDLRDSGEKLFAWKDLSGDSRDSYEFVCDKATKGSLIKQFEKVALECQYERKYSKSSSYATMDDLDEFRFTDEPIARPSSATSVVAAIHRASSESLCEISGQDFIGSARKTKSPDPNISESSTYRPVADSAPEQIEETMIEVTSELHLYDFESATFVLQSNLVEAKVLNLGNWDYWLTVTTNEGDWLNQAIVEDTNPIFNFEYLSFIFNHYSSDGSAHSWLLRFKESNDLERFQVAYMRALWEHLNQIPWHKSQDKEREYVLEAFQDLTMEDADDDREDDEDGDDANVESQFTQNDSQIASDDDDDSQTPHEADQDEDGNVNSQLAVGYKHDRSFVVRGSKIGVFRHTDDNQLQFSTNISRIETPKGRLFSPKKIMLHAEDSNMILQDEADPNSLYRMDLECGKVVDEWKIHDDIPVTTFTPSSKFAQMTNEQTFVGLSHNALFGIDPRLSGNKLVESNLKTYATKLGFSAAATTDKGYIAVASAKGDIRLFDRLGIQAKTHIPALGDAIIGLDTSADGRWILATTRTYLLLVDALQQHDGKNSGKLGFEKSFPKDQKPQPRRLGLSPEHVAQFWHETRTPINFTPAHFNTGLDASETSIVTATGPFIVTWNLRRVLAGKKDAYVIKRYDDNIKADDFKFGSDKRLIVALPNEVNMVGKRELRRPTRESICVMPRRSPRRSYINRTSVVDSPY